MVAGPECGAAFFPGGKTTVDSVSVGIVGDDEDPPLGLGGRRKTKPKQRNEANESCPHSRVPVKWKRQPRPASIPRM